MTLAGTRDEVVARVSRGSHPPKGKIPFTPRAKKTLELSLREALALHHNYIGTEHILLGVVREGEGVAAQILAERAGDLAAVRQAVLDVLPAAEALQGRRWRRRRNVPLLAGEAGEAGESEEPDGPGMPTTPAARAGLADPDSAAARTLTALGVNLDEAREALRHAEVAGTSDEQPEERGRRQMTVRVTDGGLVLEVTDPALQALARAAVEALGDRVPEPGTIPGDVPDSDSLAQVWLALRDSLEDIRQRALRAAGEAGRQEKGQEGGPEKGQLAA